jgi:ATP-dependent Lhr-like helicase
MVNLPTSPSNNYEKLDPRIQRWIFEKGWEDLRDIQEKAIPLLLDGTKDAILSATTASGKTEAAFFPLLTIAAQNSKPGFCLLYISPLKALINDQFDRLEDIAGRVDVKVTPWHGDIDQQVKQKAIKNPSGVLLITPESLEALLDRHAAQVNQAFLNLEAIIVDEVHAFIGTERGKQLQSLLSRLENLTGQTLRRVGLSATLGDMNIAASYLRPEKPENVEILVSHSDGVKLKMVVSGILIETDPKDSSAVLSKKRIADNIFANMRDGHHLVFANSRADVEEMAYRLSELAEERRVPCDFFPHHGSLSKEIREDAEKRLKNQNMPATAVCTSTLELGIDIGQVKSIVQIGEAPSVASLRQRVGRSGRRGEPAILRVFVEEPLLIDTETLPDRLNLTAFRVAAQIELLLEHWVETPRATEFHLSTLVHQVLALICERGSIRANLAYESLCSKGAFRNVSTFQFVELLRCMGKKDLIVQSHDGDLVIGLTGEKITSNYEFFAVFVTPKNYEVVAEGRTLGELSAGFIVFEDMTLIFAGRPLAGC